MVGDHMGILLAVIFIIFLMRILGGLASYFWLTRKNALKHVNRRFIIFEADYDMNF